MGGTVSVACMMMKDFAKFRGIDGLGRKGFTLLEVILVIGILGMFILCVLGFFLSRNVEPLKAPGAKSLPAKSVVKEVTLPAESKPAEESKDKKPEPGP